MLTSVHSQEKCSQLGQYH